ncbi:nickel-dependent hydrogenase large subunit [Raineyella fluvialis]|uniref:Hydrogenase 1 large subunit n=1 Tax=Raineyella fluvialis TaxID=2662261 RepID=A0A5Q2FDD6_9ACTN|nr:nickel-dependent hydrogenase large subunit [Raineyella fluvialis]QGF23103.1 hydrogenase 1 large subunit [Raineyella fluvialis]
MAQRVVIDPLTRIEGHLRIELETGNHKIDKAWSETTQFRGIETIVAGRDPRDAWAFVQRICGVCTSVHAVASIVAVENAIGSNPPTQARLIRDMVLASQNIQDHVIHFYHLHALDWVNVPSAATADPQKAVDFAKAIGSTWKGNTVARMTEVRDTVKGILDSGQLTIFTGGYWNHPDYRLPPEANLMAVAHYLDALQFQRSMIRIGTVFGGKNPHPNFLVGGMACTIDPSHSESINQVQIDQIRQWIAESAEFVNDCYLPDATAIMGVYKDYFDIGAAQPNYLAVGLAGATYAGDPAASRLTSAFTAVKPGAIYDGDLGTVHPFDPTRIAEWVSSAWYTYQDGDVGLTPDKGETTPHYTGPQPPYDWVADHPQYTWSKAPRYDGRVVQVGPVARVMLAYAQGHPATKALVDAATKKLGITVGQLNSTAGRTLARALECSVLADILARTTFPTFVKNLKGGDIDVFDPSKWEPSSWPASSSGFSLVEVPRGFLSHWVSVEKGKVARYQAVVPTTWLAGGRDAQGRQGPYEESLAGKGQHPLADPSQPLEPLRTIHSFDPCMSCAVHVMDPEGAELQVATS